MSDIDNDNDTEAENFGRAEYVIGRNRKNPILVYTSKSDRTRVYEFMVASRFKAPGLVSWKCVSCLKIRNDYRNLGEKLNRKIPLILVDNDTIKEDPERPLNAAHFCNGKDAIDSIVNRAKLGFLAKHEHPPKNQSKLKEAIQIFAKEAVDETPIPLNAKEKKFVERVIDSRCLSLYNSARRRKMRKLREEMAKNDEPSTSNPDEEPSTSLSKDSGEDSYYCEPKSSKPADIEEEINVAPEKTEMQVETAEPNTKRKRNDNNSGDIIFADMQDVQYDIELV